MSTDTAPEVPAGSTAGGTADEADNVRWFAELGLADLEVVGGKNASLGEMISNLSDAGVSVPDGFATTAAISSTEAADVSTVGNWCLS